MKRPRTGVEAGTARSPLRLRLILASAALVVFTTATLRFAIGVSRANPSLTVRLVLTVACGVLAGLAAVELIVVLRRCRNDRNTKASR
ncbi:DUF6343 family protein [Streptomyces sp. NPDC020883]|uniref:DUF6343 family protein n=1 Tax=Streptomyces sp. NPDC020883 TaxID=3365099 RepID=UPI003798105F